MRTPGTSYVVRDRRAVRSQLRVDASGISAPDADPRGRRGGRVRGLGADVAVVAR